MQILEIPPINGSETREALISSKLLVPLEAQRPNHFECGLVLDEAATDAVALELMVAHGVNAAREIAAASTTDSRVSAALVALLALESSELRNRLARFRSRMRRADSFLVPQL